jgi:hypothetical protein
VVEVDQTITIAAIQDDTPQPKFFFTGTTTATVGDAAFLDAWPVGGSVAGRARIHWSNRSRAAAYLSRNQKFEPTSLQRRVRNEPAPLAAETPVNAPIGSVPPGYRSPRASAPLRILRKAAQPRSAACGVSADSRNAPTAPGSSHRHPAPVQPGPTPAASPVARAATV